MVEPFLLKLCKQVLKTDGPDLHPIALVFPNRRAGLYFRKHLSTLINKPVFLPSIFSIEDFILMISGKKLAENHEMLLILYSINLTMENEKARSFEDFLSWAPALLEDFNEIDLYMADAEALFGFLTEAKAIHLWDPSGKSLTDFQKAYLSFYQSLIDYYKRFHTRLREESLETQGSAYRYVAEHVEAMKIPWKKVVFAGFNALTLSEEVIIKHLKETGHAEIFWDADDLYLSSTLHEAGNFLREQLRKSSTGSLTWTGNYFREDAKSIHILGVPQYIGQVKMAGQVLAGIPEEEWAETALILCEEQLLIPMLNSIPPMVKEFNITMGLPLSLTPPSSLFESVLLLYQRARRYQLQKEGEKAAAFYFQDLLAIFRHPWFGKMLEANENNAGYQADKREKRYREREEKLMTHRFFSGNQIIHEILKPSLMDPYPLDYLFVVPLEDPSEILKACQRLTSQLKEYYQKDVPGHPSAEKPSFELEYLYSFSQLFSQVLSTWKDVISHITTDSLLMLFRQSVAGMRLSFYGEPLKGIQIMGMLESRNLDFKNVIMLNVNDDVIPSGKSRSSFIPLDIKEEFHLPTYKDRQAVFAYHFYHSIQRAENVHLLYNTVTDPLAGGEKSRFIMQIQEELPAYNPRVMIREEMLSIPVFSGTLVKPIVVPKDEAILAKIARKNRKGWSASSLNTFNSCSLKFYFAYILEINETTPLDETIDPASLGTAVHETFEKLYKPLVGHALHPGVYDDMLLKMPGYLSAAFQKNLKFGEAGTGENFLLLNVAESAIRRYLYKEAEMVRDDPGYRVLALEQWITTQLGPYTLSGIIDRVDRSGQHFRIVDYKTGKVDDKSLNISDISKLLEPSVMEKGFQLLFYSYLLYKNQSHPPSQVSCGLVSVKRPDLGIIPLQVAGNTNMVDTGIPMFEEAVKTILETVHDPERPFTQTDNPDICQYCAYRNICLR